MTDPGVRAFAISIWPASPPGLPRAVWSGRELRRLQRDQASLPERGCLSVAERSGHIVQVDRPRSLWTRSGSSSRSREDTMSLSAPRQLAPTALIITVCRRDYRYNGARQRQEVRRDLARLPAKLTTESGGPKTFTSWNRIGEWLRRLEPPRKVARASRRTPSPWWIRESAQPRRPRARICCRVVSPNGVAHAAEHPMLAALVTVSAAVS